MIFVSCPTCGFSDSIAIPIELGKFVEKVGQLESKHVYHHNCLEPLQATSAEPNTKKTRKKT